MNMWTDVAITLISLHVGALAGTLYALRKEVRRRKSLQSRLAQLRAKTADRKNRDDAKAAHQTCLVQEQLDHLRAELARRDLERKALRLVLRKADETLSKLRKPAEGPDCTTSTSEAGA